MKMKKIGPGKRLKFYYLDLSLLKARSHDVMCDCDLLYQEMECCLRFSDFVLKVQRVWMQFPLYLHWNHTSQSHRMGVEPNSV